MLETATNDKRLRRTYDRAHAQRAIIFCAYLRRLRSFLHWPLANRNGASLFSQPRKNDCPA